VSYTQNQPFTPTAAPGKQRDFFISRKGGTLMYFSRRTQRSGDAEDVEGVICLKISATGFSTLQRQMILRTFKPPLRSLRETYRRCWYRSLACRAGVPTTIV